MLKSELLIAMVCAFFGETLKPITMNTDTTYDDLTELQGQIERITYTNEENGYTVARIKVFCCNPEWVRLAVRTMSDMLMEVHEELWKRAYSKVTGLEGSLNYNGCWSSVKTMSFDCDISCNVSPKAFEELLLAPLVESMRMVDNRIYHLDGPGAIPHLDALLNVSELHAIQWVPGYGNTVTMQWIPLIRRIQDKGKGVQVHCLPEEIESLMAHVRPEGLCISTYCRTENEARDLLRLLERLSNRKYIIWR